MKTQPFSKPLLQVLLFTAPLLFSSCLKYDPYLYTVSDIKLFNADNSGNSGPITDSSGTVNARAYAMQIQFTTYISGREGHIVPEESGFALQNKTTDFNIYSSTDFDGSHPAGTSLNDLFLYAGHDGTASAQTTVANGLANQYLFYAYAPNGNDTDKPWTTDLYILLMKPPASMGYRTFILHVAFANNTQFTDSIAVTLR